MKRYISLVCVALIVVMCMASPVSAAETQSVGYADLLSLGYVFLNGTRNYDLMIPSSVSSGSFVFPYNLSFPLGKFEMLIFTYSSSISFSRIDGVSFTVEPSSLGSGYYVVSGDLGGTGHQINFANNASNTFLISAKGYPLSSTVAEIPFDFQVFNASNGELLRDDKQIFRVEYEDDPYYTDSDNYYYRQIRIYPNKDDLAGLDYFDLDFYMQNIEIDSISASFGGNALDVSYTTSFIGDGVMSDSVNSGEAGSDKTYGIYKVVIRVDVSGISLVDGLPTVFITYNANNFYGYEPYVYIYGINASCYWNAEDPYVTWFSEIYIQAANNFLNLNTWLINQTDSIISQFSSLKSELSIHFYNLNLWIDNLTTSIKTEFTNTRSHITSLFDLLYGWIKTQTSVLEAAIRGDTSPGDSFQQEVEDKDQQLNDMAAVMDSVDRPELNSVNVSADNYVDSTVLASSMSGITTVIGGPVFLDMIMMSILMATAGYVLFGKR